MYLVGKPGRFHANFQLECWFVEERINLFQLWILTSLFLHNKKNPWPSLFVIKFCLFWRYWKISFLFCKVRSAPWMICDLYSPLLFECYGRNNNVLVLIMILKCSQISLNIKHHVLGFTWSKRNAEFMLCFLQHSLFCSIFCDFLAFASRVWSS